MLNKGGEGFGYAAIAASMKKVPAPTSLMHSVKLCGWKMLHSKALKKCYISDESAKALA